LDREPFWQLVPKPGKAVTEKMFLAADQGRKCGFESILCMMSHLIGIYPQFPVFLRTILVWILAADQSGRGGIESFSGHDC